MSIEIVPARWECPACGTSAARSGMVRCASCGGPLRLARGDEIVLDQIVMRGAGPARLPEIRQRPPERPSVGPALRLPLLT